MALTVPDQSYLSVSDAESYVSENKNDPSWGAQDTAEKEAQLRQATKYLDNAYNWRGDHPKGSGQLRNWPRLNVVDRQGRTRSGIPQEIKDATAELAYLAMSGDLRPANDRGGQINRVKAGDVEVEYEDGAPTARTFPMVDLIVQTLTEGSPSSNYRLVRT